MESLANLANRPAASSLLADDITEFHAARILLLIRLCGSKEKSSGLYRVDGLTKLAKLDFFVRYPDFFTHIAQKQDPKQATSHEVVNESPMVRHHYGPWDKRYYHVLAYLESRGLLTVTKPSGKMYRFQLTRTGQDAANSLAKKQSYSPQVQHMRSVKELFGNKSGTALKDLIYEQFDEEVAKKDIGELI